MESIDVVNGLSDELENLSSYLIPYLKFILKKFAGFHLKSPGFIHFSEYPSYSGPN